MTSFSVVQSTSGDEYVPMVFGAWIDVAAPVFKFSNSSSISLQNAIVGDLVDISLVFDNSEGLSSATNMSLTMQLPPALTPLNLTVDGIAATSFDLDAGVSLGTIASGDSSTVVLSVSVDSVPATNPFIGNATIAFDFEPCGTGDTVSANFITEQVALTVGTGTPTGGSGGGGGGCFLDSFR